MANNDKENKIEKFTKEAIGKTLNQFNKEIGIADLVEVNKNQDRILNGILSQVNDENTEKTEKSNIITLDNSTDGIVELKEIQGDTNVNVSKIEEMPITHDIGNKEGNVFTLNEIPKGAISIGEIQGNTMVNCNKDDKKELVLMKDLSTQGDNSITLTEGVDGGKVDVALEGNTLVNVSKTKDNYITHEREEDTTGNHIALADEGYIRPVLNGKTMVNVCDQKEPIAVTKSYAVENSGNHIALQGEYDGKCRPVVTGNTLVNLASNSNLWEVGCSGDVNTDYTITSTDDQGIVVNKLTDNVDYFYLRKKIDIGLFKPSTTYTIIFNSSKAYRVGIVSGNTAETALPLLPCNDGYNTITVTSTDFSTITGTAHIYVYLSIDKQYIGTAKVSDFIALEGDYTDKPIPDYFDGLQSSFEDNLVTQEMVDNGEEVADNLGKYRVDYKVTGKNLLEYPYIDTNKTVNGITFTDNGDGSITVNGTSTGVTNFFIRTTNEWFLPKGTYTFTSSNSQVTAFAGGDAGNIGTNAGKPSTTFTIKENPSKFGKLLLQIDAGKTFDNAILYPQLEEGDTATEYEPYKEATKTLYLNSPLLEGDTIEEKDNGIYHVHRYKKVILDGSNSDMFNYATNIHTNYCDDTTLAYEIWLKYAKDYPSGVDNGFCDKIKYLRYDSGYRNSDNFGIEAINTGGGYTHFYLRLLKSKLSTEDADGFKSYLQSNPITAVYKLQTPAYELIEQQSNLVIQSYTNGHLDFNTAVPVEKVEFKNTILENKYLYTNTEYTIQFESDGEGEVIISLGGTTLAETSIVKGINKIAITTPETLTNNNLVLEGIGFNISNIVVTPAIEQDFGYFSGLSSTFESELVTQEMVDNGEEVADNLGKYRVDYKVTGKNKFDLSNLQVPNGGNCTIDNGSIRYYATIDELSSYNGYNSFDIEVKLKPNTIYSFKCDSNVTTGDLPSVCGGIYIFINGVHTYSVPDTTKLQKIETDKTGIVSFKFIGNWTETKHDFDVTFSNIQLEEGDTLTSYEPYKEATKTLYLNSPLLKGDTIEQYGNNIVHIHRSNKVVLDGGTSPWGNTWWESTSNTTDTVFSGGLSSAPYEDISYCDKLPIVTPSNLSSYDTAITIDGESIIRINIPKELLSRNKDLSAFRTWLNDNPITLVGKLKTPQYEVISTNDELLVDSYVNGHLDFESVVPVEKVDFLPFTEELTYLYANTQYTVQFISDATITVDITLGGTQLLAQSIVIGLNRISITTPATLVDNKLVIDGVGANISEVVVTDTDRKFKYFKGMKSVGECEDLEVKSINANLFRNPNVQAGNLRYLGNGEYVSTNQWGMICRIDVTPGEKYTLCYKIKSDETVTSNGTSFFRLNNPNGTIVGNTALTETVTTDYVEYTSTFIPNYAYVEVCIRNSVMKTLYVKDIMIIKGEGKLYTPPKENKQQLTHEPLRAVKNVKDKYVLIDGKWYIERNFDEKVVNGTENYVLDASTQLGDYFVVSTDGLPTINNGDLYVKCDKIPAYYGSIYSRPIRGIYYVQKLKFKLLKSEFPSVNIDNFKAWLSNNPIRVVYQLATPVYEPIDYNPLEVYNEVTHISVNSAIPTNIIIKNHGFNCLLKPSTTYTISSNLGLNTVTTGADIGDSCLRFYDTDTSDVTTMKDVLLLEGDWTSKANLIPSNFSGIESAFEQELVTDENDVNYGKYKVTAKVVGKNLVDSIVTDMKHPTGKYVCSPNYSKFKGVIPLPRGTYRLSFERSFALKQDSCIFIWSNDGKKIQQPISMAFEIKPNDVGITWYCSTNVSDVPNIVGTHIQVESGTQVTAYEPYKESNVTFYLDEPLRGVENSKDRVFVKDDKVIVQRNCGNLILDGSDDEYWEKEEARFSISISNVIPNRFSKAINNALFTTDSLVTDDQYDSYAIINGWGGVNKLYLRDINKFTTLAELKQYLQQNPVTVVYELAEPTYEEVEYSSNRLILNTFNNESFNNSTLFLDTNISPKLSFKPLYEELVYVKNSTKYYIQFNAVGSGEVVINLGGTELTTEIVEGHNCIPITTPSESTNLMTIIGQGITISEVIVSEVVCGGYYKGIQSCFEEHMENGKYRVLLRGIALDGSKVNGIKLYINEPLRGIGDTKDRLCIKNGKLMVERKYGEEIFDGSDDENWRFHKLEGSGKYAYVSGKSLGEYETSIDIISNVKTVNWYNSPWTIAENIISIQHSYGNIYSYSDYINLNDFKSNLKNNPIIVVYPKDTIIYEEATNEYGLPIVFEGYENGIVYIDSAVTPTTHIKYTSNNQLATTLSEAEEQNISTQEDINMNVVTYMMDIDMILTEMEMSNDTSVMAVRRDNSNENMLDRMSEEDKKVYRDNTVVMLEKMITANVLEKEDIEGRINMYYNKNRISKEQYEYLKSLL